MSGVPGNDGGRRLFDSPVVRGLLGPWLAIAEHRRLVIALLRQEITSTYARSVVGLYWIVLLPLFYAIVLIGVRFFAFERASVEWVPGQVSPESTMFSAFAMVVGLLVFWVGSEILSRSPGGIRKHSVLVTDTKFPLEVLPWVTIGLALFNFSVRFLLLAAVHLVVLGLPDWQLILVPLAVVPLVTVMVGIAYLFAAVGVYLSDLEFLVQILMTALFLLSGVLFPLMDVPEPYRTVLYLNPIATTVEEARKLGLDGQNADWGVLIVFLAGGLLLSAAGYAVFRRLSPRFNDAL